MTRRWLARLAVRVAEHAKAVTALAGLVITAIEHKYISSSQVWTLITGLVAIVGGVNQVPNRKKPKHQATAQVHQDDPAPPQPEPDADPLTGCRPVAGPSVTGRQPHG